MRSFPVALMPQDRIPSIDVESLVGHADQVLRPVRAAEHVKEFMENTKLFHQTYIMLLAIDRLFEWSTIKLLLAVSFMCFTVSVFCAGTTVVMERVLVALEFIG
ncbi:hypothetical protein L1987_29699 [Smallanthus sonchifolius]|uniref:Uncharacterized protein n=1 Tax=Smallanthus sonchifolius TaxID=185202 RepID=A0ACB9I2I4_9ASTR|nr:hypothetical protein L1987_29699 [Smallanthus sonchifolius]